jgi:Tol biopolymer transport system component
MLGPWGTPSLVPGADSTVDEDDCTFNSARTELYFKRNDAGDPNLYLMTRMSPTSAWNSPNPIGVLNSTVQEESPRLTPDDLTLYFGRNGDIYKAQRNTATDPWMAPTPVGPLNTADYEKWAAVCSNGYVIVARQTTANSTDLFEGTVSGGATMALTQLNSPQADQGAFLSSDCLTLYFQSSRDGNFNIYKATRNNLNTQWTNPTALTDFNTATYAEEDPWVSTDQRTFIFSSNQAGNKDVYISTR